MTETKDQQIEHVLDKVRPFLQRDGGDVVYIGFKDGVVYLRMMGACEGCIYMDNDITAGVEIILMEEVPGIIRVDASGEVPQDILDAYTERERQKAAKENVSEDKK
ncbi:MAG: NifU family protein [Bacilli bacterium]|jgi:Fe-S cluster biogenesis protein NfuA|nr:NifU family protein [Bacilli bacterium]